MKLQLEADDLKALADAVTANLLALAPLRGKPFYTLSDLADMTEMSTSTWRRISENYPAYFSAVGGTRMIRPADLDELLELHKGSKLATSDMTDAEQQRLTTRRLLLKPDPAQQQKESA
jgi:hypothetical protein